jgi:adenosine kinase
MKKPGKILVYGTIGIDVVFSVYGTIKERIHYKDGLLLRQNLMFTAESKREFFGGTGANIAYGLGLLGARPTLFSVAGKDFPGEFKKHLQKNGVKDFRVFVDKEEYTGNFYSITDAIGEQIGIWQPNAYAKIDKIKLGELVSSRELKSFDYAIFSPGTPESILKHMKEFKKSCAKNTIVIFDPGQVSVYFKKENLKKCFDLCNLFIANETEFSLLEKILGENLKNYLKNKNYIETKGEEGSGIYWQGRGYNIPIIKPKRIAEPTGVGDAYRAGLIYGLSNGVNIEKACLLGAQMASKCIEDHGCQEYKIKRLGKT